MQTHHDALGRPKHISVRGIGCNQEKWLEGIAVEKYPQGDRDGYLCYVTPEALDEDDLDRDIRLSGDDNLAHTKGLPGFHGGKRLFHGKRGVATVFQGLRRFFEERRMECAPDYLDIAFRAPVSPGDRLRVFLQEADTGDGRKIFVEAIRPDEAPSIVISGDIRLKSGDPDGWYVPFTQGLWGGVSTLLGTTYPGPGTIYTGVRVQCKRFPDNLPVIHRINLYNGSVSREDSRNLVIPFVATTAQGIEIFRGESIVRPPRQPKPALQS